MHTTIDRLPTSGFWHRHPHLGSICLFTVIIGGIYSSVLDGSRSLVTNGPWSQPLFVIDPLAGGPITAPLTRLAAASWLHLQLPVFDPFQGFGIPLLSDQGVPVYPLQIITHLLFPGNYSVWNVVNLVALAFGVYLLASSFGQRFLGAMSAGLLASLAGAAPPNVNMSMLNPLAVLPLVLVAVRYAVDPESEHRPAAMLGIATSVALLCLSGFQEVLPLMAVVIVVYTVALVVHYQTWRARPVLMAWAAASAVAGGAVGSVGILPTLAVVGAGTSLNLPDSYLPHTPVYWLSTLTLPTITGHALNQAPQDVGNVVYTIGTPLLVLVVVLASLIAIRRDGAHMRWYVFPGVVLVLYGVLGYADIGHVLQLMDIPLFDTIHSVRFLQFMWWIPLCLLLGAVVSNARLVRWQDALVALGAAGAFDAYFFVRFHQALVANHVPTGAASIVHAPIVAAGVVVVFVAAALAARRLGAGLAGLVMALMVLASCVYDLPTNFAPASYEAAATTVAVPGYTGRAGEELAYFGLRQLPTKQYTVQVYGPLVPKPYRDELSALFSGAETGGFGPLYGALPTLTDVTLTPRAVSVLGSLGVDLLVLPHRLSGAGFTSVPPCAKASAAPGTVCFLGRATTPRPGVAYAPPEVYAYRIVGADPLVQETATPVTVRSTAVAIQRLAHTLSTSTASVPAAAYVTSSAARLRPAKGVKGVSRHATTQRVTTTLHSRSAGVAVLKEAYEPGVRATVDGRRETASPVDGGLWTAVEIGPGTSRVVLDYATTADQVEFGVGAVGLALLALLWVVLGVLGRRRRGRGHPGGRGRPGGHGRGGPRGLEVASAEQVAGSDRSGGPPDSQLAGSPRVGAPDASAPCEVP